MYPSTSLYKISKYRRGDSGEAPRLSVLGSGAWDRLKERAKKRIKDIARDLIKLYAKRRKEKVLPSPDSFMQHELEASFLYEDTLRPSKATQELKQDMESARPMDRLGVVMGFARQKLPFVLLSKLLSITNKWQYWYQQPSWHSNITKHLRTDWRTCQYVLTTFHVPEVRNKPNKYWLIWLKERLIFSLGHTKLIGKSVKWHDSDRLLLMKNRSSVCQQRRSYASWKPM